MAQTYDHLIKIMLIGDSGVGKTAIQGRFSDNIFGPMLKSTIGELGFPTKAFVEIFVSMTMFLVFL